MLHKTNNQLGDDLRNRKGKIPKDASNNVLGSGILAIRNPTLVSDRNGNDEFLKKEDKARSVTVKTSPEPRIPRMAPGAIFCKPNSVSSHSHTLPACATVPNELGPPASMMSAGPVP